MSTAGLQRINCPRCSANLVIGESPAPSLLLCASCGNQFRRDGGAWPAARTSSRAVASVVLGCSSVIGVFVTGIPAFLLGMWALSDIRSRREPEILLGRRIAITGAALGAFFSLLTFALPLAIVAPLRRQEARQRQLRELRERVRDDVRKADWTDAAARYEMILEIDSNNTLNWLRAAALHARTGDTAAYQGLCERMLERFGNTTTPDEADKIAKACLLVPTNDAILDSASRLAYFAVQDPSNWAILYSYVTEGLAEYRNGNYPAAIEACDKCLVGDPAGEIRFRTANVHLIQSLAYRRIGQTEAAAEALEKGRTLVELEPQSSGDDWHDDLICRILLKEAEGS